MASAIRVDVLEKQDVVHNQSLQCVQITFDFSGEHVRSIIRETNFVEQLLPRIRETVDDLYDHFLFRHISSGPASASASASASPVSSPTTPTHTDVLFKLGPMKRVMHVHHYADKQCAVCQQDFIQNEFVRILPNCKHVFHKRCIDQWIFRPPHSCPTCREVLLPSR